MKQYFDLVQPDEKWSSIYLIQRDSYTNQMSGEKNWQRDEQVRFGLA